MKVILSLLFFIPLSVFCQGKLSYKPLNPKPGDDIIITYSLPDSIFFTPDAFVVKYVNKRENLFDVPLLKLKKGNSYSATIKTDTSNNLVVLSFRNAGKWDNNSNNGYLIPLMKENKYDFNTYLNYSIFYNFYGPYKLGLKRNVTDALTSIQKEFELFPDSKNVYYFSYLGILKLVDSNLANKLADSLLTKKINLKSKARKDYDDIHTLSQLLGDKEKTAFYYQQRLDSIPLDIYNEDDLLEILKKNILKDNEGILTKFQNELKFRSDSSFVFKLIIQTKIFLANQYPDSKNWESFKNIMEELDCNRKGFDFSYSKAAGLALEDSSTLKYAKYFGLKSVLISKYLIDKPGIIPNYLTKKELDKNNKTDYGYYSQKYSNILLKAGEIDSAYYYAYESAVNIENGNNIEYNSLLATIAAKTLKVDSAIYLLENFIKSGKYNDNIIAELKNLKYIRDTDTFDFNNYLSSLKSNVDKKYFNFLLSQKINIKPYNFILSDLNGNIVRLSDFIGKTVVIDFWSTWCSPCIASFPQMNKLVSQYKTDSNIIFLFINTLENSENKSDYIKAFLQKNKYSFNVLLDEDNSVAKKIEIENIPQKIIIGKDGNVKFKSVGYQGDALLKRELQTIIEILK